MAPIESSHFFSQKRAQWLLLLLLLAPYLLLLKVFGLGFIFDFEEFAWAFRNTVIQSFISALCSLGLGLIFAYGYFALKSEKNQKIFMAVALAPNFLPPLFILLSVLEMIDPMPRGWLAISFVHTLINLGLCSMVLIGAIQNKLATYLESALVLGVRRRAFFFRVVVPLLKKDFLFIFAFVFNICFSSFSIPLILGGGKGTTLQVLIYEKMRIANDWSSALVISFLQSFLLLLLGLFIRRDGNQKTKNWLVRADIVSSKVSLGFFILLHLWLLLGYFFVVNEGIDRIQPHDIDGSILLPQMLNSVYLGLLVAFFTFVLLSLFSFAIERNWFQRFLDSYTTPSTAFVGFVFLLLWPTSKETQILRLGVALSFLFIPFLLKLYLIPKINLMGPQKQVAQLSGASEQLIWFKIVWPQVMPEIAFGAAIAAAWAIGDFALARMMLIGNDTLALAAETLMSSYRLPLAGILSVVVLVVSTSCFFVVRKLIYVFGENLKKKL